MKIHRSFLALFLSTSLIFCSSTFAFEKSHLEAAKELVALFKIDKMMNDMAQTMGTSMADAMVKQNGCNESIKKPLSDLIIKFQNKLINQVAYNALIQDLYASEFTEQEIKEIIVFYKSPVGKKTLDKMPALMSKSAQNMQKALDSSAMQEFQMELQKLMETSGCQQPELKEKEKK